MPSSGVVTFSQEALYALLHERAWLPLFQLVHRHHTHIAQDPLCRQAVERAADQMLTHLEATPPSLQTPEAEALEMLFLLHTGGFYELPARSREVVIEHLVRLHADRPAQAVGYARHAPERPVCAATLQRYAPAERQARPADVDLDVRYRAPEAMPPVRVRGLFRSQQEAAFFRAVRAVYPTFLVYPNVALHAFLDADALRPHLTAEERSVLFRGLVDCVVFDPAEAYRPVVCFELDSALHDDPARAHRDWLKDRILAQAGCPLYRLRHPALVDDQAGLVAWLRASVRGTSDKN